MATDTVRETNIGPHEQRRRAIMGIALLLMGGGIVAGQLALGAGHGWRTLAVVPFFLGMLGVLQAHSKT